MGDYLGIGKGVPIAARGVDGWQRDDEEDRRWRELSENDRYEFTRAPSAPYLIREHEPADLPSEDRDARFRGARQLIIVFRSGHQIISWDLPGWLGLRRAIREADSALDECSALRADALINIAPRADWLISPLISQYVYVAAPGGMSLCHCGLEFIRTSIRRE